MGKFIKKKETIVKTNGETTTIKYNKHGDTLLESLPNGEVHRHLYKYDVYGNKTYHKACYTNTEWFMEYEYDKDGNVIECITKDNNGRILEHNEFKYDDNGTIIYDYRSLSDIHVWYDMHRNVICQKTGDDYIHYYYRYDDHGHVLYETNGNYEIKNELKYNDHGDTIYMKRQFDTGETEIIEWEYEYDKDGNKTFITEIHEDGSRYLNYAYTYYENHNIKTMITRPLSPYTLIDEYDESGNKIRHVMQDGTEYNYEYTYVEEDINNEG